MRVARLIIYEGDEAWIRFTLERSLQDGETSLGRGHTITALPVTPIDHDFMIGALRIYTDHFKAVDAEERKGGDVR